MPNEIQAQTNDCCSNDRPVGDTPDPTLLLALALAVLWFYSRRNLISGTAKVISGNSFLVGKQRIRIYAMYSLYPGQQWYDESSVEFNGGTISRTALAQKIDGKKVRCWHLPKTPIFYNAKICRVYLDGEDVGKWMVRNGYAASDLFPSRRKIYAREEKRAKKERLGIQRGVFDHPLIWYRNRFRDSARVKDLVEQNKIESYVGDDEGLDGYELGKWTLRAADVATGGGMELVSELGEWVEDF